MAACRPKQAASGLEIEAKAGRPFLTAAHGEESSTRIRVNVGRHVAMPQGQQHSGWQSAGIVPLELTTTLGLFYENKKQSIRVSTQEDGSCSVPFVVGPTPGLAEIKVAALDGSKVTSTVRVSVVTIDIQPASAAVTRNEDLRFECLVVGSDSTAELTFRWRNVGLSGWLKPPGMQIDAAKIPNSVGVFSSPVINWNRYDGYAREGSLQVEMLWQDPVSHKEFSLGTASAHLVLAEYRVACAAVGIAERKEKSHSVAYGLLIPAVDGAIGYEASGKGFNDPLYYGSRWAGQVFLERSNYRTLSNGYFASLTSRAGSGYAVDKSDAELIAELAWRFEGGEFEAWPIFGPSATGR